MNPSPSESRIGFGINPVKGPDGKWWVSLTINHPPVTLAYALPLDGVPAYLEHFNKAVDECRRNELGLVLPK